MFEYVRVPVSATHAVDVPVPFEVVYSDPTRAAVVAYVNAQTPSDLAKLTPFEWAPEPIAPPETPTPAHLAEAPE